jgi:hypothetical protein
MSFSSNPVFGRVFSRPTLTAMLAAGVALAGLTATPADAQRRGQAQQESVSQGFAKVAAPFQEAVTAAKKRPAVAAAKGKPTELASALSAEKAMLDSMYAAATTPFDQYTAGALALDLGQLAEDPAILRRALSTMIESGKAPAESVPQLQFFLGQTAYQLKDMAAAQRALQAAVSGGYRQNDVEAMLAQAYISNNQIPQGLAVLRQAIDAKVAAGQAPPENWYRAGLGAAYRGKLSDQAAYFSTALVKQYPTAQNWAGAITVLRDTANYAAPEKVDLLRLMARTDSYQEARDYVEFIQAADARRYPGEVLDVIAAGAASGKLPATNVTAVDAKAIASKAVAADKASLPSVERDARAAGADARRVMAAGDTFLSYKQPAKAIEFYTLAQSKPGVDMPTALTRLGIAQVDAGQYAAAQATLAKVEGPRKPLAELWSIYAGHKAAGK